MTLSINKPWPAPPALTDQPMLAPLAPLFQQLSRQAVTDWPTLPDYQALLNYFAGDIYSHNQQPIRFVSQDRVASTFASQYEARIFLTGEVQTRLQSWHDFFQVCIWSLFPATKVALNALHYHAARSRLHDEPPQTNRSPLENALTLFDECGAIILTDDPALLDLIEQFSWQELFWQRRQHCQRHLRCMLFGHALYEKSLQPYIGMTANSLLLLVSEDFLKLDDLSLICQLDQHLHRHFASAAHSFKPTDLHPFPLLGMPGWHQENNRQAFYQNRDYFRNGRSKKPVTQALTRDYKAVTPVL